MEELKTFPIESAKNLTYERFFQEYMVKNVPCLIRDGMDHWPALEKLVKDNAINIQFFEDLPDVEVPVADCSVKYFNSQEKICMTLKEYLKYWKEPEKNEKLLYLKDWHFVKEFPKEDLYQTPIYFRSDWLNEYWKGKNDDYKFVYLGPQGSWTPFHSDVFGSFSWSANVIGQKKWIFVPKGKEPKNVYDISESLPRTSEHELNYDLKIHDNLPYFEIIQNPKEIIFVPSGWCHQVTNLTDTLSINHNWFNGTNIVFVWNQLELELKKVQKEMQDCFVQNDEEWKEMCQKLLLACHGMNYSTFIELLETIVVGDAENRTEETEHGEYDRQQVKLVLNLILRAEEDLLKCDHEIISQLLKQLQ